MELINLKNWRYEELGNEDFVHAMKLSYLSGKQRIKGFLVWSGYNSVLVWNMYYSCNTYDKYFARAVYARDINPDLLDKIEDETYWPANPSCAQDYCKIDAVSTDYSNFIRVDVSFLPGKQIQIYRKTTETGSNYQLIATKTLESSVYSYYDIDPTLSSTKIYVYKIVTVENGKTSSEVNGKLTPLVSPTSASDYELWLSEFTGAYGGGTQVGKYGIVIHVGIPFSGTNGQRDPAITTYPVNETSWTTFKNKLLSIPEGRRVLNVFPWWRDNNYYVTPQLDYYSQTSDGTLYDSKRFVTVWGEQNASDAKSSIIAFLTRAKNEGLKFDILADDKESQHNWHLESAGSWFPSPWNDARVFKAMVADSRFTTKKHPITGKTFAEQFIINFNQLTGRNLLPPPSSDYSILLEPFITAGCKPGETSSTCFKYPSLYWTPYTACPTTGCDPFVGSNNYYIDAEKTAGRLRSTWPSGLSDGGIVSGYSLYQQVTAAWNGAADDWTF
ncbi:MAG: hypothetical protein EB127_21665, partial [Alphaproteobacteria bacterium]|nr:hypothetical protein [Alphaproteobacteria bacterium]